MIRGKLSPRAEQDLEEIRKFIAAEDPCAAERVRETILARTPLLS
jgi:plasmid stabilization system protein ParE